MFNRHFSFFIFRNIYNLFNGKDVAYVIKALN
nr:MAG TPA: hypothetical protein [Caudoviricetes sp.]